MSELLAKYKRDPKSVTKEEKDQIILKYTPLIRYIAQKIAMRLPSNIELDDLMSSGVIGLMDAIEKYDPSRDNKFKTYAEFRIRGAILDELRAQDWVPRSIREKAKILERAYLRLEQRFGRSARKEEVAEELNIAVDDLQTMIGQVKSVNLLSLDDVGVFPNGDRKRILGILDACRLYNPLNQLNFKTMQNKIISSIEALPEKQRLVLSLYYYEDLNLKEIGRVLNVTESRVSQLHTQSIIRLRQKLKELMEAY
ncbi:FliA/WhiG family RNA polymerase sigma factor [Bdellovibrionota bacterium]